nr:hypothetical protein [Clostridia bacterium]
IKDEFSKTLIDDIENEKTCHGAFIQFISQCNKILLSNISVEQTNIFEPCRVDIQKLFDMINNSLTNEPRLEGLEEYIKKKMSSFDPKEEISLLEFVKRYKTEYITYDHGIYGALIFLCSVQYYYMLINKLFVSDRQDPIADIMSTLCWNVERNSFERRLKRDNAFIIQTVLRSIFCHNLYPDDLRNVFNSTNEWRYDFMKEPSNYFAMMIDSLQTWNRSKYYKFSDVNWWPTFSSDEYDISIKNNSIILKVIGYESDLEFLNYKFIKEKEKYLKEFSSYVTLDFKNTK